MGMRVPNTVLDRIILPRCYPTLASCTSTKRVFTVDTPTTTFSMCADDGPLLLTLSANGVCKGTFYRLTCVLISVTR